MYTVSVNKDPGEQKQKKSAFEKHIKYSRVKTAEFRSETAPCQKQEGQNSGNKPVFCEVADAAQDQAEKKGEYENKAGFPVKQVKETGQEQKAHILKLAHSLSSFHCENCGVTTVEKTVSAKDLRRILEYLSS